MYVPAAFAETDDTALHSFMEQHSFATLITQGAGEPFASHLPLLLDREQGQLLGHFARANPQSPVPAGEPVLAIFHGPHAYISPTWYEATNTVPTWNYQAVHVYGRYIPIESVALLKATIERTVTFYEASLEHPWSMQNADPDFIDSLLKGIVGFQIEIERIEGKFKLSQNHSVERREKVIQALKKERRDDSQAIAALMQSQLPEERA